jgi:DNA-binding NarL/FixJ family response regulator
MIRSVERKRTARFQNHEEKHGWHTGGYAGMHLTQIRLVMQGSHLSNTMTSLQSPKEKTANTGSGGRLVGIASPVRIMLVDDHAIMRTGLAQVLSVQPGFQVICQADDGESALILWPQQRPDVTLLDISLTGINGIETLRRLRAEHPAARVLMLTSSDAQEDARQALQAGAAGFITKTARAQELVTAIRTVHQGGSYVSTLVQQRLDEDRDAGHLSAREMEVLSLIRRGFTNGEIGKLLHITERTVRGHVEFIMRKLNASDRASAVARGFETGILKP